MDVGAWTNYRLTTASFHCAPLLMSSMGLPCASAQVLSPIAVLRLDFRPEAELEKKLFLANSKQEESAWSTDPACGRLEAQQELAEDTRGTAASPWPCLGNWTKKTR
jgi:hypothetical protein